MGPFEIEVPRDRAGTFTPRLVRKGQRRLDGLDAMIISLYAGGMTVRDIQHHLASTLSVELSVGTISRITDAVADAVLEWQRRPLEESSSRWSTTGAIRVKVRVDHRVASRSAHIAVGARDGRLSSTWLKYLGPGPGEGASLKGGSCALSWPTGASRTS